MVIYERISRLEEKMQKAGMIDGLQEHLTAQTGYTARRGTERYRSIIDIDAFPGAQAAAFVFQTVVWPKARFQEEKKEYHLGVYHCRKHRKVLLEQMPDSIALRYVGKKCMHVSLSSKQGKKEMFVML